MSIMKFVAYYRVSTDRQGKSGLGLEAQRKAVMDYLSGGKWELLDEVTEIESGKRDDRPKLTAALKTCKRQKATLVIAKLDRLARDVHFISSVMKSGVEFIAVDMPHANKLTVHILAAVAEHEREMISHRTKVALRAAKARGVTLGSPVPEKGSAIGVARIREKADLFAENIVPIIASIRTSGITTLKGIADALNARGIRTARGGSWHPTTVRNILGRSLMG